MNKEILKNYCDAVKNSTKKTLLVGTVNVLKDIIKKQDKQE
jgi:hypothetical protein